MCQGGELRMRCIRCGDELRKNRVGLSHSWKGQTVRFRGLPVFRCVKCRHMVMTPGTVNLMNDFIETHLSREEEVPDVTTAEEAARYLRLDLQGICQLPPRPGKPPRIKRYRRPRFFRSRRPSSRVSVRPVRVAYAARGTPSEEDMKKLTSLVEEHRRRG